MYKLLLVTAREDIQAMFREKIDWVALNCRAPLIVSAADEAVEALNSKAVDAVGIYLPKDAALPLIQFLRYERPSLPVFEVYPKLEDQMISLREAYGLLNRLHDDYMDEYYDEDTMLTMQRDELIHSLLVGNLHDWEALKRELHLIRARLSLDQPCVVYEIDMPQGEVYLSEHQGHAQQRLESALRNNFFGRYVDGIYYAVAVLTPRHIRLVCIPMQSEEAEAPDSMGNRADDHVRDSIQRIKEYLDLDMEVIQSAWLESIADLLSDAE